MDAMERLHAQRQQCEESSTIDVAIQVLTEASRDVREMNKKLTHDLSAFDAFTDVMKLRDTFYAELGKSPVATPAEIAEIVFAKHVINIYYIDALHHEGGIYHESTDEVPSALNRETCRRFDGCRAYELMKNGETDEVKALFDAFFS